MGALLLMTAKSREKMEACACSAAGGAIVRGVTTKCVTEDCTIGWETRRDTRGGESETESSLAWTDLGEGGLTTTTGPAGGVGGYECGSRSRSRGAAPSVSVASESVECCVSIGGRGDGRFVRHAKDRAASAKYGDVCGRGSRGMNTPGGKDGGRKRMYQPRFGR